MPRRINIWGGPGIGKSTYAAELYAGMKRTDKSAELIVEHSKLMAYKGERPELWNQADIFFKQLHKEWEYLQAGVGTVITANPLLLTCIYCQMQGLPWTGHLVGLARYFEEEYPSVNLQLVRRFKYDPEGRFENIDEAVKVDIEIHKSNWLSVLKWVGKQELEEMVGVSNAV